MTSSVLTALVVGLTAGALSTAHCAAMCGPVAVLASAGGGRRSRGRVARFLAGRLGAYAIVGALAGGTGMALEHVFSVRVAQTITSLALALALASLGWRMFAPALGRPSRAARLEGTAPTPVVALRSARPRPPLLSRVLASLHDRPALLGAALALVPCGALFAALGAAALPGSAGAGAITMLGFGGASSAGLLLAGSLAGLSAVLDRFTRRALGVALFAGALVLVLRPLWPLAQPASDGPSCHADAGVPR